MCSECVSLSVNFYRKTGGVRMRGHETSSSAQRDVPEFLSFSHRKWMLLDSFRPLAIPPKIKKRRKNFIYLINEGL